MLPPPPRRSNRLVLFLVLGIVVALALCAGIATTVLLVARRTTTASGTPAAPGADHGGDLRTYLLPRPADSRPWAHPTGTDEHLSLEQDAQLADDATAMAEQLRQYGFQDGAVRTWRAADGALVEIRLLRFDGATDAAGFYRADADSTVSGYDTGAVATVGGIPEGVLIADPTADKYGYGHLIGLARKADVVFVLHLAQQGTLARPAGETLLKQQYDRL